MADTDKLYNSVAAEKARATYVKSQLDLKIDATEKGAASGVATLDESGLVPSTQLPSYVDDVIDLLAITDTAPEHCAKGDLYFNTTTSKVVRATATDTWGTGSTTNTDPEKGKIYVNLTNDKTYRWSGSAMIEISSSDVIGIKVGSGGSTLTPSQGVIELPEYEAGAQVNPSVATPSTSGVGGTDGLLSAEDKEKLNGITAGAQPHQAPTSTEITTALGYTPYDSANPDGYTTNTGTVTGIKVGSSGSDISPVSGIVTIPAYEEGAQVNPSAATPSTSGTGGTDGLMTAQDKEKLNGIETGAQVNPGVMGASGSTHSSGLVPDTPSTAGTTKFLREDGTWQEVKDVIEGYLNPSDGKFYATRTAVMEEEEFVEWQYSDEITGTSDKLYAEKTDYTKVYRSVIGIGFAQVGIRYGNAQPYVDAQTPGLDGLMSAADKARLYSIPSWSMAQTKPSYGYTEIGYEVATAADNGNTAGIITIDGTKPVTVIALTGDVSSLDLASGKAPAAGHSAHVILSSASAHTVAIAHDATVRVCPKGEDVSLSIPAGGYAEVDFLNANSKIFVRGV